jgi:UDP-glucose 4-epimerase
VASGRALVTGAGGFIASHLVERLVRDGVAVRALVRYTSHATTGNLVHLPAEVRREVEVVRANVEDPGATLAAVRGCDTVYHLAALIGIPYSYAAPQQYVATNVGGTLNVLEAARAAGPRRTVVVSTSEVYGSARYTPIDEAHPLQAQSPYAATKIGAEKLAQSYGLAFGLPVVVVRPFNTYGPRQSARAVIPAIVSQMLAGDTIRLGALTPVRDFTFVADTVGGLMAAAAADTAPGDVFNLGTGRGVSIGQVAERCLALSGLARRIVADPQRLRPEPSEVVELIADASRAAAVLGWRPKHTLEDGLRATIAWIREHPDRYRPSEYAV